MKKGFVKLNGIHIMQDVSDVHPLQPAIYMLMIDEKGNFFLKEKDEPKFRFDFKVYGIETPFIERVMKVYEKTKGNMGILLNGIQGTGKTITGEIIANELNLPIILITFRAPGMNEYLSLFEQDVVIFIDEYEKVFKGAISEEDYDYDEKEAKGDSTLLSLMSGIHTSEYRRFFILTTNKTWINENMINRPGRLMFLKNFSDLRREQIKEIIDDILINKAHEDSILNYMKPLKIITVDIVKAIVNLVNIFDQPAEISCIDLNVEFRDECYDMYMIDKDGRETCIEERVEYNRVKPFLSSGPYNHKSIRTEEGTMYILAEQPKDNIYVVNKDYDNSVKIKVKLKKASRVHSSLVF